MTAETEGALKRLEELEKTAIRGPWRADLTGQYSAIQQVVTELLIAKATSAFKHPVKCATMELIAESRNALPGLIAALREAVKALESYRNETHGYGVAQRALSTIETLLKPC